MPIFSHLRRAGLGRYASCFESFGFYTKEDFDGLELDTIKAWIPELLWDSKAATRFKKLLDKDARLMNDYVICGVPAIKDVYHATFAEISTSLTPAVSPSSPSPPPPSHSQRSGCDRLCDILAPDGKGLCSIWQLKWHLQCYCGSEEDAVLYARDLVAPRVAPRTDSAYISSSSSTDSSSDYSALTTLRFCMRVGIPSFEACAHALEENGYKLVKDFCHLGDSLDNLKEAGFEGNEHGNMAHAAMALAALSDKSEDKRQHVKMNFTSVDFVHARTLFEGTLFQGTLFSKRFRGGNPSEPSEGAARASAAVELSSLAVEFARAVTDSEGFGKCGLGEITQYLAKFERGDLERGDPAKAASSASRNAPKDLVSRAREPPPSTEEEDEPEGWIVEFLKTAGMGLEEYAPKFLEQKIVELHDLQGISDGELNRVFEVSKLGHRKKLQRMIKAALKEREEQELRKEAKVKVEERERKEKEEEEEEEEDGEVEEKKSGN